jgi:hypothetical protein
MIRTRFSAEIKDNAPFFNVISIVGCNTLSSHAAGVSPPSNLTSNFQSRTTLLIKHTASTVLNFLPRHILGPPPNTTKFSIAAVSADSHRLGSKALGFGKLRALRHAPMSSTTISVPAPRKAQSPLGVRSGATIVTSSQVLRREFVPAARRRVLVRDHI